MKGRPSEGTVWALESPEVLLQSDKRQSHCHLGPQHYQSLVTSYYFLQPGADKCPCWPSTWWDRCQGRSAVLCPRATLHSHQQVCSDQGGPKGPAQKLSIARVPCPLRARIILIIEDELVLVCNPLEPSSSRPSSSANKPGKVTLEPSVAGSLTEVILHRLGSAWHFSTFSCRIPLI